jgi:hypothetical protein
LRYRLVELHTWKSPRSGEQLCGEVCGHCYFGTGKPDDCRTCKLRRSRSEAQSRKGVRPLEQQDVLDIFRNQFTRYTHRG